MNDLQCCGTDACIINSEGYCWCGQQWDGKKMCFPSAEVTARTTPGEVFDRSAETPPAPKRRG
jgi:hypothetical protein